MIARPIDHRVAIVTVPLARHIATARDRALPAEVEQKTCLHILDTIAAMVSGSKLKAGRMAIAFARSTGRGTEATVIGSVQRALALHAALANGMLAHADETDDSHAPSLTHPGCAVVPAALAMAELEGRNGRDVVRAVAAGYDVGTRIAAALGADRFFDRHHSSHSFGGLFGAAAAAASLAGFDEVRASHTLAYAAQLASGNAFWRRDPDHVEKAFDFGGMPAHNGVLATLMVRAGFTASSEPLEGNPGLFAAFPEHARPELAIEALGERYEVMRTAIKKWCVGSPIQAALDSLEALLAQHAFTAAEVDGIVVALPRQSAPVVDNRDMPDVNLQHQLALMLEDGAVTFASSHDGARMAEPKLAAMRARIRIDPRAEDDFVRHPRQAIVRVRLADGRVLEHRTLDVHGTPGNPMARERVEAKARELMLPLLGSQGADAIIQRIRELSRAGDVQGLMARLQCAGHDAIEKETP